MTAERWRKKPVEIEAVRFTGDNHADVAAFTGGPDLGVFGQFLIDTREGVMKASAGDWIIKGVAGEFYPCKPDIFEQTYEPASSHPAPVGETGSEREALKQARERLRQCMRDRGERDKVFAQARSGIEEIEQALNASAYLAAPSVGETRDGELPQNPTPIQWASAPVADRIRDAIHNLLGHAMGGTLGDLVEAAVTGMAEAGLIARLDLADKTDAHHRGLVDFETETVDWFYDYARKLDPAAMEADAEPRDVVQAVLDRRLAAASSPPIQEGGRELSVNDPAWRLKEGVNAMDLLLAEVARTMPNDDEVQQRAIEALGWFEATSGRRHELRDVLMGDATYEESESNRG